MYQTHQEDQTEWGLLVLVKGLMGWGARGEAERGREGSYLCTHSLTHSDACSHMRSELDQSCSCSLQHFL